jgi:hypothetical protein
MLNFLNSGFSRRLQDTPHEMERARTAEDGSGFRGIEEPL